MNAAIDTNVLLDVLIPDAKHLNRSKALLEKHLAHGRLLICEVVYAEIASHFPSDHDLNRFLRETNIRLIPSGEKALHIAGQRWARYSRNRGTSLLCNRCGHKMDVACRECRAKITARQRVLEDFVVAAHASVHADVLLSRERNIYKTYFPDLRFES
jgi:predicted nucleic acid-binding protein